MRNRDRWWFVSKTRSNASGLFLNKRIAFGTVRSNEGTTVNSDFEHLIISKTQILSPLTAKSKSELAEIWFEELDEPDKRTAESTRKCKTIFALIYDLFQNRERRSKLKIIRDFAVDKKT